MSRIATMAVVLQSSGESKLQHDCSASMDVGNANPEYNREVYRLCQQGELKEALHILQFMNQQGIQASIKTYACLLQGCIKMKALKEGKKVHAYIIRSGLGSNVFLGNSLINMYSKFGNVVDAHRVFDTMHAHDVFSWTSIISAYAKQGKGEEAVNLFQQMQLEGVAPDKVVFVIVLNACASLQALEWGKQIHAYVIKSGCELDVFVGSTLVDMYSKCGSIEDACQVFHKMHERNIVSWNAMITGYARQGHGDEALALFEEMQREGVKPDRVTFISLLKACARLGAIHQGKQIHGHIIKYGFESDIFVGSSLVHMYTKCGRVEEAHRVFSKMHKRNVVTWTAMIAGYAERGQGKEALILFDQMQQDGMKPDAVTFVSILKACTSLTALEQGKQVHACIVESGCESDACVGNSLVHMYVKCGSIEDANRVFNKMQKRNLVSWNVMIAAYVQQGHCQEALKLFEQMQWEDMKPDNLIFVSILKACISLKALESGKKLHACIRKRGFESNVFVGSTLVDMYAKCGHIEDARQVFDKMHERDVVCWNAMISGYAQQGHGEEALILFKRMQWEGMKPNTFTFVSILKACTCSSALKWGQQIHTQIINSGCEFNVFVGNALIDMYAKCGSIEDARQVFNKMCERDLVSWNAMIAGYAQKHGKEALKLFEQMKQEGVKPDTHTFVSILKCCAALTTLEYGKQFHADIIKSHFDVNVFVGNALIDMYAKCGSIEDAYQVFSNMLERSVVSWNAMIGGYVQQGQDKEALTLFQRMLQEGMNPDNVTFASILKACTNLAALHWGRQVHCDAAKRGLETNVFVGNALIDMYAKCGSIEDAHHVFNKMMKRDVVTFNVIIAGYAQQGCGEEVLRLFKQMQRERLKPDNVTLVFVLSACSHTGLVDEGLCNFDSMIQDYSLTPTTEHHACMVDLLGRAGHLDEADDFISKIPFLPDAVLWMALLGACRSHGNVKLGRLASDLVLMLEPKCARAYVLLSNIYASIGRWDEVAQIRQRMQDAGMERDPGCY